MPRIALAIILITGILPAQAPVKKRRVPPPLFSQAYVEALHDVLNLEPNDVAELERRLAKNPDDFAARLKLMAYHKRADRAGIEQSQVRRGELMLWLVQHRPESEILGSPYATFQPGELKSDQAQRATRLWQSALATRPTDARIMWNAANFYAQSDRKLYLTCLEKAVALAPANENYSRPLGLLYAGAILNSADPALTRHATQELETTRNPFLLEPAVKLLQSEYNASLMRGRENAPVGELARRYFNRAKALDPDLDEAWIFPKIDPKMVGMLAPGARPPEDNRARLETAAKQIRRLAPDAFPDLPAAIVAVLRSRGCRIPQPTLDGKPRNVIRGEFFAQGQPGWAVLCSVRDSSSILVFRNDSDTNPQAIATSEDKSYLQGGGGNSIVFSRLIHPVDRNFILAHYRAYGGPEPPPIDHHGIDDAFLEKASVTYYWHAGKWLRLQGAD